MTNRNRLVRKAFLGLIVLGTGLQMLPTLSAQNPKSKTTNDKEKAVRTLEVHPLRTEIATQTSEKGKQNKVMQPQLLFKDVEAHAMGDTLRLHFIVEPRSGALRRNEALHIVPVYSTGDRQYPFRSVVFQDPLRHRFYLREMELLSREEYKKRSESEEVAVLARSSEVKPAPIRYEGVMLLPSGLLTEGQENRLELYQFLEDCCDYRQMGTYSVSIIYPPKPEPKPIVLPPTAPRLQPEDMLFYRPEAESVKLRAERATVRIHFRVGKYDILPAFGQNYLELTKVTRMLSPLMEEAPGDIEVQKLTITGYASPEGSSESNLILSQHRADSFKSYLITLYGGLSGLAHFSAIGVGEDWSGLRKLVKETPSVPMKEEVLGLIDNYSTEADRETRLMQLGGGSVYKYLLDNLYPSLRRMDMEVSYKVRHFTSDEVEAVYDRRPQDLSQEEIYEVAQRRNKAGIAHPEYGREYDMAVRYYPNDKIANLNASSAALLRGDLPQAWHYLSRVAETLEASTNMGLYYWLSSNYSAAARYFEKALKDPRQAAKAQEYLKRLKASGVGHAEGAKKEPMKATSKGTKRAKR